MDVDLDAQLPNASGDTIGMLSFQKLRVHQRCYTDARGSAMETAAALDTMRVIKLIDEQRYAAGIALLESINAMRTNMTGRSMSKVAFMFRFTSTSRSTRSD